MIEHVKSRQRQFQAAGKRVWVAGKPWSDYVAVLGIFMVVSAMNLWLQGWCGYEAVALVYLLAVVLLALFAGRGAILLGTALSAAGWNFLFVPPRYSFHIGSFYDKMMLSMYFIVALTVGQLTARLRAQRLEGQKREETSTALYFFTRELAEASGFMDILDRTVKRVQKVFDAEVAIMLPRSNPQQHLEISPGSTWQPIAKEQSAAAWAFEHNQSAGKGISNGFATEGLYLPLSAGGPPSGVLGLRLRSQDELSSEQRELLENFVRQSALVLDRQRLRESELNTRVLAESERLGRTLLNSVSHELRTPIAAISSAAGSLCVSGELTPIQRNLANEIEVASSRLNRVVQSLLSAARLHSGQIRPRLDWCEIADVTGVTLRNLGTLMAGRSVEKRFEPELPLIKADFVLLEQALANLLMNAVTHTPQNTPIEISARVEGKDLVLDVADHGPGLPPDQAPRIFDLFHRAPGAKPGGIGLGLAIVKGFVEAQGGHVSAANYPGGGAIFSIHMPITEPPVLPEDAL